MKDDINPDFVPVKEGERTGGGFWNGRVIEQCCIDGKIVWLYADTMEPCDFAYPTST